jgi:hypothetical protein
MIFTVQQQWDDGTWHTVEHFSWREAAEELLAAATNPAKWRIVEEYGD